MAECQLVHWATGRSSQLVRAVQPGTVAPRLCACSGAAAAGERERLSPGLLRPASQDRPAGQHTRLLLVMRNDMRLCNHKHPGGMVPLVPPPASFFCHGLALAEE